MQDSGPSVVVKNRYLVTKSKKSFHFDNTGCPHFPQPRHVPILTVPLYVSHHLPWVNKMRETGTSVRHFLKRIHCVYLGSG